MFIRYIYSCVPLNYLKKNVIYKTGDKIELDIYYIFGRIAHNLLILN